MKALQTTFLDVSPPRVANWMGDCEANKTHVEKRNDELHPEQNYPQRYEKQFLFTYAWFHNTSIFGLPLVVLFEGRVFIEGVAKCFFLWLENT